MGSIGISFFPPDEPKYVDAALRMIETHNYIVPFFNCHVRFDKPILYYWELVGFFKLFSVDHLMKSGIDPYGIIEYAARLPSIITGALTAVYVYLLSCELFGEDTGWPSVVGFLSIIFFFYLPRAVYPDMSLILFELMGVYYFIKNRYYLGWAFTALAFLVKGPIGIVSVGFTYILYLWIVERKSVKEELFSMKNIEGFVIFLIISLPWYVQIYKRYGMKFVNKFFLYHNIERFTGAAHQHPHSLFYFFPIVLVVVYLWWPYIVDLVKNIRWKDRRVLFLGSWFLWVFIFFSISRNKLPHYIAFGFIPMAILFGIGIKGAVNTKIKSVVMGIFEIILGVVLAVYFYRNGMWHMIPVEMAGFIFISALNFVKNPLKSIFYKIVVFSFVAFAILLQFEGYRATPKVWREVIKTHLPLVQYKVFNQSLVAYTRKCSKEYKELARIRIKGDYLLYTKVKYLKNLEKNYTVIYSHLIDKGKKTALIRVHG